MSKAKASRSCSHSEELQGVLQGGVDSLHTEARALLADFIAGQYDAARGAFVGRDGQPDLYYCNFGLSCAMALGMKARLPLRPMMGYLCRQSLQALDLIHQACWIKDAVQLLQLSRQWRCFSPKLVQLKMMQQAAKRVLSRGSWYEQAHFLADPYMIYIAINLLQDLKLPISEAFRAQALQALDASRAEGGRGYSKSPQQQGGSVCSTTVAAILSRRQLSGELDAEALDWLQAQQLPVGGFVATEDTPLPDMLSTAVALYTLHLTGRLDGAMRDKAKQFLSDHWLPNGGFASVIDEDQSDCEYTYYGLLSLGALAS